MTDYLLRVGFTFMFGTVYAAFVGALIGHMLSWKED